MRIPARRNSSRSDLGQPIKSRQETGNRQTGPRSNAFPANPKTGFRREIPFDPVEKSNRGLQRKSTMSEYQCIEVDEQDSITRVRFLDSKILEQALVKQLAEELQHLVANASEPRLLLDLSVVTFLSSAALNNLVILNKKVQNQNGKFVLVGVQPPVYEVFNITGLNRWFKIADTVEEALTEIASAS